jgi:hypothetical protein
MAVAFIERIEATQNIQFPLAALFLDGQLSAVIAVRTAARQHGWPVTGIATPRFPEMEHIIGSARDPEPCRVGVIHRPHAAAALPEIVRSADDACLPVMLFRAETAAESPALVAMARRVAETVVLDEITPEAIGPLALSGVTPFHDGELEATDLVRRTLDLPGASADPFRWDKLRQRELFKRLGVASVLASTVDNATDLRVAAGRLGLPGVLKPRRATWSSKDSTAGGNSPSNPSACRSWRVNAVPLFNKGVSSTSIPRAVVS